MQGLQPLLQLFAMLAMDPRTSVLFLLLIVASVTDYRTYKIPNWLTVSGMAFGLIYNTAVAVKMHAGFSWAFEGLLLGSFVMLPFYALRVMGAGDVKLMAMVGAFLGVPDTLFAVIFTFIVGGMAALGFALLNGALGRMLGNIRNTVQVIVLSAIGGIRPDAHMEASKSVGKLPYGVSIGIGTMGYVTAKQLGYM